MSSVLLAGPPSGAGQASPPAAPAPDSMPAAGGPHANNTVAVIAGIGVLLLAMGVGVLIGRSGASKQSVPPAQVISVASTPSAGAAPTAEASFTDDWPAGSSGYTVQLQTLPQTGTLLSSVEAAKSAASAKGAKAVGALKSEDFSSLAAGHYVIYAGVYHERAQAQKALSGLKKSFPTAIVISVSNGAGASSAGSGSAGASRVGSSESHPAPPSVLKNLAKKKGKSYEQESKNLPDVISTG